MTARRLRVLDGNKAEAKNAALGWVFAGLIAIPLWAALAFVTTWFVVETLHVVGLG